MNLVPAMIDLGLIVRRWISDDEMEIVNPIVLRCSIGVDILEEQASCECPERA